VEFLGYIISRDDIHMDPCKVQTIVDWAIPAFIQNVQCFLRFANFYRHYIAHYFSIVTFLIQLTKKYQPFSWGVKADNAFQFLKVSFMTTPLLIHVNLFKPFILVTDVSNFAIGSHNLEKTIFLILSTFVLISFLLQRLITRFMIKNF